MVRSRTGCVFWDTLARPQDPHQVEEKGGTITLTEYARILAETVIDEFSTAPSSRATVFSAKMQRRQKYHVGLIN